MSRQACSACGEQALPGVLVLRVPDCADGGASVDGRVFVGACACGRFRSDVDACAFVADLCGGSMAWTPPSLDPECGEGWPCVVAPLADVCRAVNGM